MKQKKQTHTHIKQLFACGKNFDLVLNPPYRYSMDKDDNALPENACILCTVLCYLVNWIRFQAVWPLCLLINNKCENTFCFCDCVVSQQKKKRRHYRHLPHLDAGLPIQRGSMMKPNELRPSLFRNKHISGWSPNANSFHGFCCCCF